MIPSEDYKDIYNGNGSTTLWDRSFPVTDKTHVHVVRTRNGVDTDLTVDVDYTVQGVNNSDSSTWKILFTVAPLVGDKITSIPNLPLVQMTDLQNQAAYFPEVLEAALDYIVMCLQQLQEQLDRAAKGTIGGDEITPEFLEGLAAAVDASADAAASSASAASSSASTASTKATEASTSATNSETYKEQARVYAEERPLVIAYASVDQVISDSVYVPVQLNTKRYDPNNWFDASTFKFTPQKAGKYRITMAARLGSSSPSLYLWAIGFNGSPAKVLNANGGTIPTYDARCLTAILTFNGSTDYAQAMCYVTAGAARAILSGEEQTYFEAEYLHA